MVLNLDLTPRGSYNITKQSLLNSRLRELDSMKRLLCLISALYHQQTHPHSIIQRCLPDRMFLWENHVLLVLFFEHSLVNARFILCTSETYLWLDFEKKNHVLFFNKEGFGECACETGGVQYLHCCSCFPCMFH